MVIQPKKSLDINGLQSKKSLDTVGVWCYNLDILRGRPTGQGEGAFGIALYLISIKPGTINHTVIQNWSQNLLP